MATVFFTPQVLTDEGEILAYLADEAGPKVAAEYKRKFDAFYDAMVDFPALCAPRKALGRNIRVGHVIPYSIIYSYVRSRNSVEILRIIHSKRLITKDHLK